MLLLGDGPFKGGADAALVSRQLSDDGDHGGRRPEVPANQQDRLRRARAATAQRTRTDSRRGHERILAGVALAGDGAAAYDLRTNSILTRGD
jgi:hypothetical protein